jgi:hypothetical protein
VRRLALILSLLLAARAWAGDPGAPTLVSASTLAGGLGHLVFSAPAQQVDTLEGYAIWRQDLGGAWRQVDKLTYSAEVLEWSDTLPAQCGLQSLAYLVQSIGQANPSGDSSTAWALDVPCAPTGLVFGAISGASGRVAAGFPSGLAAGSQVGLALSPSAAPLAFATVGRPWLTLTAACGAQLTLTAWAMNGAGNLGLPLTITAWSAPCAPAFSSQSVSSPGRLSLAWSLPGAQQAQLWRGAAPSLEGAILVETTRSAGSYLSPVLDPATPSYWGLSALDARGNSSSVSAWSLDLPPAPALSVASSLGQAQLSWVTGTAAAAVTGYRIYRYGSDSGLTQTSTVGSVTRTTQSLAVGGYIYSLAWLAGGLEGPRSLTQAAYSGLVSPSFTTRSLDPLSGELQLGFSASPSSYPVSYSLSVQGSAAQPLVTTLTSAVLQRADYAPAATSSTGSAFSLQIYARNSHGQQSLTATASFSLLAAPTGLSASAGNSRVALSWNAVPGAAGYVVYRGTYASAADSADSGTGYGSSLAVVTQPGTIDSAAYNGMIYGYSVATLGAESLPGLLSSKVGGLTPGLAPGAPSHLALACDPAPLSGPPSITLYWSPAAPGSQPISSYQIWRSTSGQIASTDALWAQVYAQDAGVTSTPVAWVSPGYPGGALYLSDTTVAVGQTYLYGILALDTSGRSSSAGPSTFTSQAVSLVLPAPTGVSGILGSAGVALNWTPPSGNSYPVTAYVIQRAYQSDMVFQALTTTAANAFIDPLGAAGNSLTAAYVYQLQSKDSLGHVGSDAVSVTVSLPTPMATTTPQTPSGFTALSAEQGGLKGLQLSWLPNRPSDRVSAYMVYIDGALDQAVAPASAPMSAFVPLSSTAYGGSVLAQLQAVGSTSSLSSTVSVAPLLPPLPAGLTALPVASGGQPGIQLAWSGVSSGCGVTAYQVYRAASPAVGPGQGLPLTQVAALSYDATFNWTDLPPAGTQYYTVTMLGDGVEGPTALTVSATTASLPEPPSSVSAISLTYTSGVYLQWQDSGDGLATSYNIWYASYAFSSDASTAPGAQLAATAPGPAVSGQALGLTLTSAAFGSTSLQWSLAVAASSAAGAGPAADAAPFSIAVLPAAAAFSATPGYDTSSAQADITLAWTAPAAALAASGYTVYDSGGNAITTVAGAGGSYAVDPAPLTNTALTYSLQPLGSQPGFSYGWVSATAVPVLPFSSSPLLVSPLAGQGTVQLFWEPITGQGPVLGYRVYRDGTLLAILGPTVFSYTDTGLVDGAVHTWQVSGLNSAGEGPAASLSLAASATTGPLEPGGLTARSGYSGAVAVGLQWQAAPDCADCAYNIYRSTNAAEDFSQVADLGQDSPLFAAQTDAAALSALDTLDPSLETAPLSPLAYAVTAMSITAVTSDAIYYVESDPVTVTARLWHMPPVVALTAQPGSSRVDLVWPPVTQAGTWPLAALPYTVYRATSGGLAQAQALGALATTALGSFSDTTAANAATYTYFVTIRDQMGNEAQDAGLATAQTAPPPALPALFTIKPGNRQVTLTWLVTTEDFTAGATYNVYLATSAAMGYGAPCMVGQGPSLVSGQNGVTYSVDYPSDTTGAAALVNRQPYWFALAAINKSGESPRTAPALNVIPFAPLAAPQGASLTASLLPGGKSVQLSWAWNDSGNVADAGSGPGGSAGNYPLSAFVIYRSPDSGSSYAVLLTLTASTADNYTYLDSTTVFGAHYTYWVAPMDTAGNVGFGYPLSMLDIPAPVNALLPDHNAFDPVRGEKVVLRFSLVQPGHVSIKVYTLQGEYVADPVEVDVAGASGQAPVLNSRFSWDGRNADGKMVASGVYLLRLASPGFSTTGRVAVIK